MALEHHLETADSDNRKRQWQIRHDGMCIENRGWGTYCWCTNKCCETVETRHSLESTGVSVTRVSIGKCCCISCPCQLEESANR